MKKLLFAIGLMLLPGLAMAQTAGEAVMGFRLAQGSTYGSFTCPSSASQPCFVQFGASIPVTGTFSATLSGFTPTAGSVASLAVTTTSSDVALPATTDLVVTNTGSNTAFFRVTVGAGTAVTTDYPILAGAAIGVHLTTQTHASAITASSTTSLQIQGGAGLAAGYGGGGSGGAANASVGNTGSAVPSAGTYIAANVGGNLTGLSATANGLKVDGSAVTQPVSNGGTFTVQLTGATNNINNVSGTVSLPTGASTAALQPTNAAQGSTTSGQTGHLVEGAATTAAPTYTTGTTNPLSLDLAGNLRVNVVAGAAGGTSYAQGSTTSGQNVSPAGCATTTSAPTNTTAQTNMISCGTDGGIRVDSGYTQGSTTSGQLISPIGEATLSAAPTYTTAQTNIPWLYTDGTQVVSPAQSSGNPAREIQADNSVAINISTATTTQLVALVSGKKIYVTEANVIAGGTGNITFEYGTGSNCGTGTTVLTGAYNLTAQAGIVMGGSVGPIWIIPASNAFCALTSAAVQMSGSASYTQF